MKSITLLVSLLAVVGLLGCATPYRAPAPAAHIKLERVDPPVIVVEKSGWRKNRGR